MSSIRCCANHFRKLKSDPRLYVITLFLIYYINGLMQEMNGMIERYHCAVSPWGMPLFFDKSFTRFFLTLPILVLLCDAPFLDNQQPFTIIRIGRRKWAMGQLLYILFCSVLYAVLIFFIAAWRIEKLEYTTEWGKAWKVLSTTFWGFSRVKQSMGSTTIVRYLDAVSANLLCYGMLILTMFFIGQLLFFCNLWMKKEIGIGIAGFFIVLSFGIEFCNLPKLQFLSPVSWIGISSWATKSGDFFAFPPFWYVWTVIIGMNILLSAAILYSVERKSIEIIEEM